METLRRPPSRFREGSRSTTTLRKVRWDREAPSPVKNTPRTTLPLRGMYARRGEVAGKCTFDRLPTISMMLRVPPHEDVQRTLPTLLLGCPPTAQSSRFSFVGAHVIFVVGWLSNLGLVLYVADTNNHRLRKISGDVANGAGTVTCLAGR